MPQMAPIWWTMLFIMFNINLMTMNNLIYFLKEISMEKKISKISSEMKWKW